MRDSFKYVVLILRGIVIFYRGKVMREPWKSVTSRGKKSRVFTKLLSKKKKEKKSLSSTRWRSLCRLTFLITNSSVLLERFRGRSRKERVRNYVTLFYIFPLSSLPFLPLSTLLFLPFNWKRSNEFNYNDVHTKFSFKLTWATLINYRI